MSESDPRLPPGITFNPADGSPLDYAAPTTSRASRALTPAQRRRRIAIALGLILCFVPFPTKVFPALTLRFADPAGRTVDCSHPIDWEGVTRVDSVRGVARCLPAAPLTLPAQHVWASPASRLLAIFGCFLPHSGGFGST